MYLRRLLSAACACVLACGLFACGKTRGEPYEPKYNGDMIPVKQADVMKSKKITNKGFVDLLERMQGSDYRPLAKSYIVSAQQSYREHFNRVVYYAYPKFTNELKGPALQKLKQYYKEQYQACAALYDFPWLDTLDEITDRPNEAMQYRLQVYAADLLDDYVAVHFYTDSYLGGSKADTFYSADVFDRQTGDKLALGGVIDIAAAADAVNKAVANYLKNQDIRPHEPYDVRAAQEQMFTVTADGLALIFAPDTLAPPAYGNIRVSIPWDAVR